MAALEPFHPKGLDFSLGPSDFLLDKERSFNVTIKQLLCNYYVAIRVGCCALGAEPVCIKRHERMSQMV